MSSLSIILPERLAKASQIVAKELGISRTEFIRQAISHELKSYQARLELEAMIKSIKAMKASKSYLTHTEEDEWWIKK